MDPWLDEDLRIHAAETRTGRPLLRPEEARAELTRTKAERDELAAKVLELEARLREGGGTR